jgi:alkylhydroperoxidase/carboxymuconolactone decarboxylase family protein YurZ
MDEQERFASGQEMRRQILGDEWVERAQARIDANAFDAEYHEMVTRHVWAEIWQRPGLDRRTRSLTVMAMLIALNRPEELRLHLSLSRKNGVSREEVKELLLQATVYAGVPAGRNAFLAASEVFAEEDGEPSPG